MRERVILANPAHEASYVDLCKLVAKRAPEGVTAEMLLAIAANMLGKLIAMQDQRTMSHERAMEIVGKNLELGNEQLTAKLLDSKGTG